MPQLSFNSKYSSIEDMVKDKAYCNRLMKLSWFQKRKEYPIVKSKILNQICDHNLLKGEEVEVYMSCDRQYCHRDKRCCYKTRFYYKCSKCGYFEI